MLQPFHLLFQAASNHKKVLGRVLTTQVRTLIFAVYIQQLCAPLISSTSLIAFAVWTGIQIIETPNSRLRLV